MKFDPYHTWLSIPPEEQPPTHYRLLGVPPLESNPAVIEHAANRQLTHLKTFQSGKFGKYSQRLMNEVCQARICLLNPDRKAVYDAELQAQQQAAAMPDGLGIPNLSSPSRLRSRRGVRRTAAGGRALGKPRSAKKVPPIVMVVIVAAVCAAAAAVAISWQYMNSQNAPPPRPTVSVAR